MPIEDSSTTKAEFYLKAYQHSVANQPQCLGSYVFYWNHKQEKTHTWYGMFLSDGRRTAAIDTMQFVWTGGWPINRCPRLEDAIRISATGASATNGGWILPVGSRFHADIQATDPEGDSLTITWDLRVDAADHPNVGGDYEAPTPPLEGTVTDSIDGGKKVEVTLPGRPGKYRLFVYAHDDHGGAATANVPILLR